MKNNFFINWLISIVRKTLQVQDVQSILKQLVESEIQARELKSESEIKSLIDHEIKQLNEANKTDLDDREAKIKGRLHDITQVIEDWQSVIDDLSEVVKANGDRITINNDKLKVWSKSCDQTLSNLSESFRSLVSKVSLDIESIKAENNEMVSKSRADTAAAIKNTRQKMADIDEKLDAFIDTVSERLSSTTTTATARRR